MTIGTIGFEHVNVIDVFSGDVSSNQNVIIEGAKNAAVVQSIDNNADT